MPYKNPHPLYYIWAKIRYRARRAGTYICPEWDNFKTFLSDVGERSEEGMILTLKNDSAGYVPGNLVWVAEKNRRSIKTGWKPTVTHPLYTTWRGMIDRCYNPNNPYYRSYGGRGIYICDRWKNDFHLFVSDMGERPKNTSIDRINNDGNYEPSNCRWATKKEQQSNRRVTRLISFNGETKPLKHWADDLCVKPDTIAERLERGCSLSVALTVKRLPANMEGLKLGGKASGAVKQNKTHCKHGHEFTRSNTYISKEGWRSCRKCRLIRQLKPSRTITI